MNTRLPARHGVLTLSTLAFIGGLGGGVVFPVLPLLGLRLGIPAMLVGLILALNRITRLAVNPVSGLVVDRFGARWPLIIGLLIEAGSTLCFYVGVHSSRVATWFLAGRALWGVGSSLLMVGVLTAALLFSGNASRGLSTAKVRMSLSFGLPAGLVLGGLIAAQYSAAAAFLTAAGITFAGALIALWFVPGGVIRAVSGRDQYGAGTMTLGDLLRQWPLWNVWLLNLCIFLAVQGVVLATLVVLVSARHLAIGSWGTEGTAGMLMAMMMVSSAVVSWLVGRRIDRYQRKTPAVITGTLALVAGFVLLAVSRQLGPAATALAAIGIGLGSVTVPLIMIIGDLVPAGSYGRAIGVYQVLGDVGGSLGPIVGLEGIQRIGGTSMLLGTAAMLTLTFPLVGLLWHREHVCVVR